MVSVSKSLGTDCACIEDNVMTSNARNSSGRSRLEGLKNIILLVVLVAEIVLPYVFYLGLRAFGDSKEKMWVLQNLMVLLTSGIFLGMLVSLAKDSLFG
jgi:hypothetical protein